MTKVSELAKMIDHSILNPVMTDNDLKSSLDDLLKMKAAGATRSGETATAIMLEEAGKRFGE